MIVGQDYVTPVDEAVANMVSHFKGEIETRLGKHFTLFKPLWYKVVGGKFTRVRIEVDGGKQIQVNIHEEMPGGGGAKSLAEVYFSAPPLSSEGPC